MRPSPDSITPTDNIVLPVDGHVHSEWSWDAPGGSMERTCARAVELGLSSLAFTEHAEFTPWDLRGKEMPPYLKAEVGPDGILIPPRLDVDGYMASLHRCREMFPRLRIRSGVELSEPHWFPGPTKELLGTADFDRVLASQHSVRVGPHQYLEIGAGFEEFGAPELNRRYLADAADLVRTGGTFEVLAHIDFPVRYWPTGAAPFDSAMFEAEYREVLEALAGSSRALEINTKGPILRHPELLRWWHESGGEAVAFGSDTHVPERLALEFPRAMAFAEAHGFRPGRDPHDFWRRG